MGKLSGKVAVVTGASKGIGAGIARGLASEGAAVVVNYASDRVGAERVVAEIESAGGRAVAVGANVAIGDDVKRLFAQTAAAFGALDILVNNAGVFQFAPIDDFTEDEFHRQFNTNVLGPILTVREALAHFGPNGGSVINVSSLVSSSAMPGAAIYASTKGALDTLTRVLALELAPRNIRVNTIAPGGVETEGTRTAGIIGSNFESQMIAATPLGRLGQPDDIARVAVFLASAESGWITGERIAVAGGYK